MVTGIRICKLPYQDLPFVHGVRDGRDVWLTADGIWTELDDHHDSGIPFEQSLLDRLHCPHCPSEQGIPD